MWHRDLEFESHNYVDNAGIGDEFKEPKNNESHQNESLHGANTEFSVWITAEMEPPPR